MARPYICRLSIFDAVDVAFHLPVAALFKIKVGKALDRAEDPGDLLDYS